MNHWIQQRKARKEAEQQEEVTLLEAIDRVVEDADPRIKLVSHYQRKLSQAVQHALQYIDGLVARVPAPVEVNSKTWLTNPYLNAFFATVDDLQMVFSRSPALRHFFERHALAECYAGLMMTRQEKKVLGMQLSGDVIQKDVPQLTVSFVDHRVKMPTATEAEARAEFKRRALRFLVTQALERVLSLRTERENLQKQKQILQLKIKILQGKQNGFPSLSKNGEDIESQLASLQQKLAENKEELQEISVQIDELDDYVDLLNDILGHAENYLALEQVSMKLSRLGVKLEENSTEPGNELILPEFIGDKQQRRVIVLVKYPRVEMLSQEEIYLRAGRYLTAL
ncbi:MAG: hypothetical protein U1F76_25460 [Candidatus Competibacteraceae bacterium]